MLRFIIVFLFFLILCDGKKENQKIDVNKGVYKESGEVARLEYIREIKLEEKEFQLADIRLDYIDTEGNLYINDYGSRVYIEYDSMGMLKGFIGKKGYGPGEYEYNIDITKDDEGNYYVFDTNVDKIIIYNKNNEFVKEKQLNSDTDLPLDSHNLKTRFFQDSILLAFLEIDKKSYLKKMKLFHIYDKNFNFKRVLKEIEVPEIYFKYGLETIYGVYHQVLDGYIYYALEALPYLYKIDFEGNVVGVYGKIPEDYDVVDKMKDIHNGIPGLIRFFAGYSKLSKFFHSFYNQYVIFGYGKKVYDVPLDELNMNNMYNFKWDVNCLIFNKEGESVKVDFQGKIPWRTYVTPDGLLYTIASDEPDNRIIKVYKIIIEKDKE